MEEPTPALVHPAATPDESALRPSADECASPEIAPRLPESAEDFGALHIHAQPAHHIEALVIGDRLGLEALVAAITDALAQGEGTRTVFCNDGEGYDVLVRCVESLDGDPTPYTDYLANEDKNYWQLRCFEAEARVYRMMNGLPEPTTETPKGASA